MTPAEPDKLKIILIQGKEIHKAAAEKDALLLNVIRDHGLSVLAPCGGKGLCKKCRVFIDGAGNVLACRHKLADSCTVLLPSLKKSARIQADAVPLIKVLPDPGPLIPAEHPLGVAVDIGTTTVVVYLVDLESHSHMDRVAFLNPQQNYGQDVISRIHYAMEHPGGLAVLQGKIIAGVNDGVNTLCRMHKLDPLWIVKTAFVGNTTMLHLLLGVDPASIAVAPFTPSFTEEKHLKGQDLKLLMNPAGEVLILPSVSGYVGADITAGLASTPIPAAGEYSLYIDIGTNGEMALGNRDRIFCCSTAAGPAFEGAKIKCGIGGIDGAISAYQDGRYETIGHERPIGICGSGLIDIAAHLLETGAVSPEGLMAQEFVVAGKADTDTEHDIVLTPRDIREIQLAKAAIAAGIRVLARHAQIGLKAIEHVYLAGGFGSYINVHSAVKIGLLPGELKKKIKPVGNLAGLGALNALKSVDFAEKVRKLASQCQYIELSGRSDFNEEYVEAMAF
jgi:uncharacterized 2Fe-2S/4Fe-4S cluster protein (DUF4445 family)